MDRSAHVREKSPHSDSPLDMEPLQVYNPEDPYAMFGPLREPYIPHIVDNDSFFGVVHDDAQRHF